MKTSALLLAAVFALAAPAAARTTAPAPIHYSDGAVGTAPAECGMGDLCASLALPNGDRLDVYNGGAAHCQPYVLNVVRMHGDTKIFDYKTKTATDEIGKLGISSINNDDCPAFKNTILTLDNGIARLGIYSSRDGSIFAQWEPGVSDVQPANHP